jgi:hypothetical protein
VASRLTEADRRTITEGRRVSSTLVTEWQALRTVIAEMEAAEHPDITDALGRVWTWIPGGARDRDGNNMSTLYGHDGMAWPREHVEQPAIGWPRADVLDNPNYRWCELCRAGAATAGERVQVSAPSPGGVVTVELPGAEVIAAQLNRRYDREEVRNATG